MNATLEVLGDGKQGRTKYSPDLALKVNREHTITQSTPQIEEQQSEPRGELVYPTFPLQLQIAKPIKLEDYVILPGAKHGNYEYSPMLVSMKRDNHQFDWQGAQEAMGKRGARVLNLRQYVDLIRLASTKFDLKALDGLGNEIPQKRLEKFHREITRPSRSEWTDNSFTKEGDNMKVHYGHSLSIQGNGELKLTASRIEPLDECFVETVVMVGNERKIYDLTSNGLGALNMDDWLNRATKHGLPPKDIMFGKNFNEGNILHYQRPREGFHYSINAKQYLADRPGYFYFYPFLKLDSDKEFNGVRPAYPILGGGKS